MTDRASVASWLAAYSHAWQTYDPAAIGALFAENATYATGPYDEPIRGREAIVAAWLENRDAPGTYAGAYEPLVVEGDRAVANGRSRYFEADRVALRTEFDNIFVLRFDDAGRCVEYREWYMQRPKAE